MIDEPTPPPADEEGTPLPEEPTEPGPSPSTWAGRSRQPPTPGPGVTDEIAAVEKALGEEIEDGMAELAAESPPEPPPTAEPEPSAEPEPVGAAPAPGDTIEADTVALSEQEAAQEAALEGLRARTATHAAKRGQTAPVPPAALAATPPPAAAATAVQPPAPPLRPSILDVGEPPKRGIWLRFVLAAILIIVSMATATAVSGLVLASRIADGLKGLKSVGGELTYVNAGDPQTILILGSDKREGETDHGRSDTTILLRVAKDHINLLSIPRDLKVFIPGYGVDKFNAAYTYGGPDLATKTVKQLTGLDINVVVNINFNGFADAVDEIGCVYVDVDHHYYHSNVGLSALDQYSEIDIPAGYQRMCGFKALQYVRYRHEDNDLVRSARQQAFLREARAQVPITKFISDYNPLINIFTKYTSSTIRGTDQLIGLAKLFFDARDAQIKEIHFPGDIGNADSLYVTASQTAVKQTIAEFLGTTASTPPSPTTASTASKPAKKPKVKKAKRPKKPPPESNLVPVQSSNTLVDASSGGAEAAALTAKTESGNPIGFPVYYPTKLVPGSEFVTPNTSGWYGDKGNSRGFLIDGGDGHAYYGYKIVGEIPYGTAGYSYSDYFGFSGTNWRDAPILDNPTAGKEINGRDFLLFFDNGRLRQVGFKTDQGAYWVENDLLETLTADQMLGMAESMTKYVP